MVLGRHMSVLDPAPLNIHLSLVAWGINCTSRCRDAIKHAHLSGIGRRDQCARAKQSCTSNQDGFGKEGSIDCGRRCINQSRGASLPDDCIIISTPLRRRQCTRLTV